MPRNGSGTFALPSNTFYPGVTGVTVAVNDANATMADIQAELTNSVAADGQTPMNADFNLNNNKAINVSDASAATDAANLRTVQAQIDSRQVSGRPAQIVVQTDAGTSTTSSTFVGITGTSVVITPKSSSSKLVIDVVFQSIVTASGAGVNSVGGYQIYNSTAAAYVGSETFCGSLSASGANLQYKGVGHCRGVVNNTGTTAISFVLRAQAAEGTPTVYGTSQVWTITEVVN